jgi:hypothetical protein
MVELGVGDGEVIVRDYLRYIRLDAAVVCCVQRI